MDEHKANHNGAVARPGTAGSRRRSALDSVGEMAATLADVSGETPSIAMIRAQSVQVLDPQAALRQTASQDTLLRIMGESDAQLDSEMLVLAESGNLEGVQRMLDEGYNLPLARRGMDGYTPLHYACNRGHAAVASELLRAHPSLLHLRTDAGDSALHLAVYSGNMLLVEQLLDRGADINAQNKYGETALFYAARKSMPAVVRLLLQRGADGSMSDCYDETAQDHASDAHTKKAFQSKVMLVEDSHPRLSYEELLGVFRFLEVRDLCRAACVSGKWHRVSETQDLWSKLGVRRWEASLQATLGLGGLALPTSFLSRPPARRPSSKDKEKTKR